MPAELAQRTVMAPRAGTRDQLAEKLQPSWLRLGQMSASVLCETRGVYHQWVDYSHLSTSRRVGLGRLESWVVGSKAITPEI